MRGEWTVKYTLIAFLNVIMVQNRIPTKDLSLNGVAWFIKR